MRTSVTIAIPAYDAEAFIEDTINSIIQQTYPIDEIIICDDCSNDNTILRVNEFIENTKFENIRLIENEYNLGYQKNWNICLETATSDFVLLLHDDDLLKPDTIEKQIQFFQNHPDIALVGGNEDFINENGNMTKESKPKENKIYQKGQIYEFVLNSGSYIACSSVMFNMEKIRQVGFFKENVLATDELYWPKVLTKFPIAVLGESLINRRIHPGQTEYKDFFNNYSKVLSAFKTLYKIVDYENRNKYKKKVRKLINKKVSSSALNIAIKILIIYKDMSISLKYLLFSIKTNPFVFTKKAFWRLIFHSIFDYKKNVPFQNLVDQKG